MSRDEYVPKHAVPVEIDPEQTDQHDCSSEALARRVRRQSSAIAKLQDGHIELIKSQAVQTGMLVEIRQASIRAEEREITKLRLNRPVAIITAIGVAAVAIITALIAHGCSS